MAFVRARWPGRIDGRIAFYLVFLAALWALGHSVVARATVPDLRMGPVDPWTPIDKPFETISIAGADVRDLGYRADRHADGGRRDTVSARLAGGFEARVSLRRLGTGAARPAETDALRLIRERRSDLSRDIGRGGRQQSKFGLMETLDIVARSEGLVRRCVLFARADMAARVIVSGEICRKGPTAFDPRHAACLADRLTLLSAGRDDALADLFQMAELRRESCTARPGTVAEPRDPPLRDVGLRSRISG